MSGAGSDVAVALAGLLRVCEPPSAVLSLFAHRVGAVGAWEAVLARRAPRAVLSATAARTANVAAGELMSRAEQDVAVAARCGARVIGETDAEWPTSAVSAFAGAVVRGVRGAGPPFALYLRGRALTGLPGRGVTMVGSRASSAYGQRVAGEMAHELASRGLSIISGAAFGIDTAAHRAALQVARSGSVGSIAQPGMTVAVLACGIDRAYPEANRNLLDAIAGCGSVVSEYPPGTTPARHRFLVRNRLIAAFGAGTVVVEAGRRSGTLSTAAAAEQLGRLVMAVPGPVTSAMSVGCHLLLADRFAQLVTNAGDVMAALGRVSPNGASQTRAEPVPGSDPRHPTDGLDLITARVYDALPTHETASVEQLVTESGLLPNEVLGSLAVLELHGMSTRDGALWRRIRPT
ncbi:DNA-processing protein DprA [Nakamurella sp. GG22]